MNLQNHSFRNDPATEDKKEEKAASAHLKEKGLVKFGDHSVYLKGVIAEPCFLDKEAIAKLSNKPNWWQTVPSAWLRDRAQANSENGWEVNSHFCFLRNSKLIVETSLSLPTRNCNEDSVVLIVCPLNWVEPISTGKLNIDSLCDEKTGKINAPVLLQKLTESLQQRVFDADLDVFKLLGRSLDTWDNTGMYAKLIHFAIIRDHAETHKIPLLPLECEADITFIPTIVCLKNEKVTSPGIYLVENFDVTPDSLDLILLLSTKSKTFVNPEDPEQFLLDSRFIAWDKVKVFVLTNSDWDIKDGYPKIDTQLITAARVYSFVEKLAKLRGEEDQLVRGLYVAMDLCGVSYPFNAGRWLSHIFGSTNYNLPIPHDYNIFARLLRVKPTAPSIQATAEWTAFKRFSSRDKIASIAIYLKLENVAATTLMASINLVVQHLVSWLEVGSHKSLATLNHLINSLNQPMSNHYSPDSLTDSKFRLQTKGLAGKWAGFTNIKRCYVETLWLGEKSSMASAHRLFRGHDCFAPREGSALAIIDLIDELPYEWCLGFGGSHANIKKEILREGYEDDQGWRATWGSSAYADDSSTPYIFHAYGWQVVNILCLLRNDSREMPGLVWQHARYQPGRRRNMCEVKDNNLLPAEWNDIICCWEPNTMKSWIWESNKIVAPALTKRNYWWRRMSGKLTGIYRPNHLTEFDSLMTFNCGFLETPNSDDSEAEGNK